MKISVPNYSDNVFINCPFDNQYQNIFNSIVFTVQVCGFIPRCAMESDDSDEYRMEKIIKIIENCKYGIHDLSRVDNLSDLPRFNMPLELGIFIGCKKYGNKSQKEKKYLILESEQYRFKKFISDISGQDIKSHNNDPLNAITAVRDWLAYKNRNKTIPHASIISGYYNKFESELPILCEPNSWTVTELTFSERSYLVGLWISSQKL
jgi:hypothetical protein